MTTNFLKSLAIFALLAVLVTGAAFGQAAMTQTTLSAALTGSGAAKTFAVASATGFAVGNLVAIDQEAMGGVTAVSGTNITVASRATNATRVQYHSANAVVWVGLPTYFGNSTSGVGLSGTCTPSSIPALPHVRLPSMEVYDCPASGADANLWVRLATATPYYVKDAFFWQPFSDCQASVSANGSGTNGFTTAGTSVTPVAQASTSGTGTNTHTFVCQIHVPTSLSTFGLGRGAQVKDVQFYYGVQTTGLGTQVATLASGTMNSAIVFSTVALPAPGAGETASTVLPVRADAGTLLITPVVASANVATTTAGGFYSMQFTPATPIAINTDRQLLQLTVALLNTATSATITNSPGFLVHVISSPF